MTVAVTVLTLALAGLAVAPGPVSDVPAVSADSQIYVLTSPADIVVRTSHSIFDGSILVPRGSAHDRFAVQNGSGGTAYVRVALTSVDVPDDRLRRSLSLTVSTAQGSGPVVPLDPPGSCVTLLAPQPVAAGATVDVDAALSMGDLTGTSGQGLPIGFTLLVISAADPAAAGCDTGGPGGGASAPPSRPPARPHASPLAATGSDIVAAIWIAVALGGAGTAVALVSRARRPSRKDTQRDPRDEG